MKRVMILLTTLSLLACSGTENRQNVEPRPDPTTTVPETTNLGDEPEMCLEPPPDEPEPEPCDDE